MSSAGYSLQEILKLHIVKDYYRIVEAPECVTVRELEQGSEALVRFPLPPDAVCAELKLHRDGFGFLLKRDNADGSFLLRYADGSVDAHIVECKRSVGDDEWRKAKKQMRWTFSRLLALVGSLGISIRSATFYTAFQNDCLQPDSAPDLIPEKLPVGEEPPEELLPDDVAPGYRLDWEDLSIKLDGYDGVFRHHKIVLNANGVADVDLPAFAN